ncbi:MAG: DsbA family protein [Pseudomonadales bacterium]
MSEKFNDQGGVSSSSPSAFARWLTSRVITRVASLKHRQQRRDKAEQQRAKAGSAHVVKYFHQLDDAYSQLAAQLLPQLAKQYDIKLECYLVKGPQGDNSAEPELLLQLARNDSAQIAPHYGLQFAHAGTAPKPELLGLATAILAHQNSASFGNIAAAVGSALWAGDAAELDKLATEHGRANEQEAAQSLEQGTALRAELKHYSGGMFYYAGEWYWGVDRLYHLERRLVELGASQISGSTLLAPRPAIDAGELRDNGSLTFEIYPSLRSPYTALIFDNAVQLAKETGVTLVIRPVLPMVMRGVPATREKGIYIFSDAVREADTLGLAFGQMADPIGEPVRRCYSLYPWACEQGKGTELLSAFLRAAFYDGVNTNNDRGLRQVVENAGLSWSQAKQIVGQPGWEELLEDNRLTMYEFGCWGVPSFRLLDKDGEQVLALWGQDRLWLFAKAIQDQLARQSA